jgi:Ion channel
MQTLPAEPEDSRFSVRIRLGEFWSGDLGLTLVTISLILVVFVTTPMREAGVSGRAVLDCMVMVLMLFAAFSFSQNRLDTIAVSTFVAVTGIVLGVARFYPTPLLHQLGSVLTTVTLLVYVLIVLVVMFRGGPVTWSRIQGGISAYLLIGMAWASAFQIVEQSQPGSFHFVTAPATFDQLISKLTYFSFCTLTTVGGEVSPVSPIARSMTIAEAAIGQLFPAILIAALVAMAMHSQTRARQ